MMRYNLNVDMFLPPTAYRIPHTKTGQAVLSTVFVIGGMVVLIGLALAFLATSFVNSAYAFQASQRAEAVALSGVYDTLMKLNRNNSLTLSSTSVPIGSYSATVTVVQDSPATGESTITSTATVSNKQRTFKVVASVASSTGQATVVSWRSQ
jgi:hypothetical protein